ncbi:DUF368 domain-containing protein [Elusimicrobiota bacterium]
MYLNVLKGMLIGIANIIPGVSGGTFALILGIYNRLILAISSFDLKFIRSITSVRTFFSRLKDENSVFLIQIAVGALLAIAGLSRIMDFLLRNHPGFTLSFFMGLIIPSIGVPYGMIDKKDFKNALFILPGALLVLLIYFAKIGDTAVPGDISLLYVFISGILAISAMILPGISGSFLLLVMGVYGIIIGRIKSFTTSFDISSFIFLLVFGAGCITGLVLFVRIMRVLLEKYRNKTLYFLIGLVLGSLVVLWPFKEYPAIKSGQKTEIAVTTSKNSLPGGISEIAGCSVFLIIGLAGSLGLSYLAKKTNN